MSKQESYEGYLIDLDGTMYRGKEKIPAAPSFIRRLHAANKRVLFVTNNSTRSPEQVAANLVTNHQIPAQPAEIYTTALATADYLAKRAGDRRRVYMIGEQGLKDALESRGFELTDQRPDFVVVGLDTEVTYGKLEVAVLAILAGATFIGTNADSNLPNERGLTPGAGSLVRLVEYATQTKPIMIGKPEAIIMEMTLQRVGLTKEQVVMVGDNYHTDIEAGINVGMDTLLVYTGVSTKEQVAREEVPPTHVVDSLDDWMVE